MSFYEFKQKEPNLFSKWVDHEVTIDLRHEIREMIFHSENAIKMSPGYGDNMALIHAKDAWNKARICALNEILELING